MNQIHTDRKYEEELKEIEKSFVSMGKTVCEMFHKSLESFFTGNIDLSYQVIEMDNEADEYDIEINRLCLNTIARRQPLGPDLRFIASVQKAVGDIERIGDLCTSISERTIELYQDRQTGFIKELREMSQIVLDMVVKCLEAFKDKKHEKALEIWEKDRIVDAWYAQVFRKLLDYMTKNPDLISSSTRILGVLNSLERIGDHVQNICECTVYSATGRDIRNKQYLDLGKQKVRGILFLCTHNSARSQIAEGLAKKLLPPEISVFSAGSSPAEEISKAAVEIMKEVDIDISLYWPKKITDIPLGKIDMVVTLCSEEVCVNLPGIISRKFWVYDVKADFDDTESLKKNLRKLRENIKAEILKLKSEIFNGS
jgi:phosphate transport system protein